MDYAGPNATVRASSLLEAISRQISRECGELNLGNQAHVPSFPNSAPA